MRNGLDCKKLHQVVLSRWVAAQRFHALSVEKLDVGWPDEDPIVGSKLVALYNIVLCN
jgi:hypothetical protein